MIVWTKKKVPYWIPPGPITHSQYKKKIHIRHYETTLTYTIGHIGHKNVGHWRKHMVAPP